MKVNKRCFCSVCNGNGNRCLLIALSLFFGACGECVCFVWNEGNVGIAEAFFFHWAENVEAENDWHGSAQILFHGVGMRSLIDASYQNDEYINQGLTRFRSDFRHWREEMCTCVIDRFCCWWCVCVYVCVCHFVFG